MDLEQFDEVNFVRLKLVIKDLPLGKRRLGYLNTIKRDKKVIIIGALGGFGECMFSKT